MRNLTKRVFSFVLALILCIGVVSVGADTVSAAEVPTIKITPLVTDSVSKQAFEVNTNVVATYIATVDGESGAATQLEVGTHQLVFNSNNVVNLVVYATGGVFKTADSTTAYLIDVKCIADDGTELKSEKVKLSKINEPQVVYNAPAVIDAGEFEYRAANPSVLINYGEDGKTIPYTRVAKGAKTVTINYVDDRDAVLYTETKDLSYGNTVVISAPSSYTANGNTYALKTTGSYDVTYENARDEYTFEYAKQSPAAQLPYDITVKLVDENGKLLHTMKASVDVGKQATVTAPATYEVGLKKYALADGQTAAIVRDYASTESKEYTVKYVLSGETTAEKVTINFVDQATGKTLDTVTATVEPDGAPYTYDISTKNYIEKDGVTYQVLAGQGNSKGKIVHAYGDTAKTYNLYYSAKQEKNPESYAVSMRYICVNDNAVLATETQIVKVNSSVTFNEAPETLKVAGKEYIRLNGQDGTTVHKYNDSQTSYEIYYRDASIKVENDDIIYVPGTNVDQGETSQPTTPGNVGTGTTVTPGAQTEPEEDTGTAAGTVVDENDETSTPTDAETEEPEEESSVPSDEAEIIEEDEVPLADKPVDEASEGTSSAMPFVIGGIALVAIIVLAIFFIVKKRRTA